MSVEGPLEEDPSRVLEGLRKKMRGERIRIDPQFDWVHKPHLPSPAQAVRVVEKFLRDLRERK